MSNKTTLLQALSNRAGFVIDGSWSHTVVLPISKLMVQYRAYTVKEETDIRKAAELNKGDNTPALTALYNVLRSTCVLFDDHSNTQFIDDLYEADLMVLFMFVRAASVGDTSQLNIRCYADDCDTMNMVTVNLKEDLAILCGETAYALDAVIPESACVDERDIRIDRLGIDMHVKYNGIRELLKLYIAGSQKKKGVVTAQPDVLVALADLVRSVTYDGVTYSRTGENAITTADIVTILSGGVVQKDLAEFTQFMSDRPRPVVDVGFVCKNCGKQNEHQVQDMQLFF